MSMATTVCYFKGAGERLRVQDMFVSNDYDDDMMSEILQTDKQD